MVELAVTGQSRRQDVGKYISVVIPAYNEEKRIGNTLRRVNNHLSSLGKPFEITIVNDGSTDGTEFLVRRLAMEIEEISLLSYPLNQGKGYAVKQGVLSTSGRFVLISDADLSTPIEEIDKFILICQGSTDLAFGSRELADSEIEIGQNLSRRVMGRVFNLMVRALVLPGVKDTQCGFKCMKGDIARALFSDQITDGFAFDVELLVKAKKAGYEIKEVPIHWVDDKLSTVRPLKDVLNMFISLVKIRRFLD